MSGLEGLLAGRTLVKRYRIEEVIGRGGFAAVYRANDERLGRPVAVKVIALAAPDEATREELRSRFQREARAAASLPQHPNVVTVHDFGTDPETGIDFLVMELLHGEDLASFLARERRPPLQLALRILREAAEGLAVGHRAGLIHRDVKPGNIFLAAAQGDDPFRVCVLDFGIARVMAEEGELTRLTTGPVPHSPAYASPEQLRGERDLTAASDVFSLGVVAYLLLTGERPFPYERSAGASAPRPVRELNPEVPPEVEAIVHRALEPEPPARFADAAEVARALDAAAGARERRRVPTAAAPPPPPYPAEDRTLLQPPPRRPADPQRRPLAGVLGLLLVLLVGGAFVALWTTGRAERGPGPGAPVTQETPAVDPDADTPALAGSVEPADTEPAELPLAGPPGSAPTGIERTAPRVMVPPELDSLAEARPVAADTLPTVRDVQAAERTRARDTVRDTVRDTARVAEPQGPPPRVLGVPASQARGRGPPPVRRPTTPPRRDTTSLRH